MQEVYSDFEKNKFRLLLFFVFTFQSHHRTLGCVQSFELNSVTYMSVSVCVCVFVIWRAEASCLTGLVLSSVHAMFVRLIRTSTGGFLCVLRWSVFARRVVFNWNIHQCTLVCLYMLFLIGISSGVRGSWLAYRGSRGEGGERRVKGINR